MRPLLSRAESKESRSGSETKRRASMPLLLPAPFWPTRMENYWRATSRERMLLQLWSATWVN